MSTITNQCDRCGKVVDAFCTTIRAVFNDDFYELCKLCTEEMKLWVIGPTITGADISGMKVLPNGMIAERQ